MHTTGPSTVPAAASCLNPARPAAPDSSCQRPARASSCCAAAIEVSLTSRAWPALPVRASTPRYPLTEQPMAYASVGDGVSRAACRWRAIAAASGPPADGSQENSGGTAAVTPSRRSSSNPFHTPYSSSPYPVGTNTAAGTPRSATIS